MTGRPIARLCRVLDIGRATAYRDRKPRARRYHRSDDATVHAQLQEVLRDRGSYGYRRARVLVNRQFETAYNRKRIQRVMRLTGLAVPIRRRPRNSRAHRGRVRCEGSNQRWCSDAMQIACWNGELVELAFALDCCDREAISYVAEARPLLNTDIRRLMRQAAFARFGNERPTERLEWLSDNGAVYTALETVIEAEKLGLTPITTPVASPESNGMSEAFVNTLRRDYMDGADRSSAAILLSQVSGWITDYNERAPHSALGYRSPADFRGEQRSRAVSGCLTK
jgi:putative transposase